RLHRDIRKSPKTRRVVHLEHGDRAAGAGDVDPAETRIEHDDVSALRHRQVGDRPVRVEVEDGERIVALTGEEGATELGVDRHAVVLLAPLDAISGYDRVRGGIDHRQRVLVLKVDVDFASHRVVLRDTGLTVEPQHLHDRIRGDVDDTL